MECTMRVDKKTEVGLIFMINIASIWDQKNNILGRIS